MYRSYDEHAEEDRRQEKERERKFAEEHCMYSSGEEIGPPGCCLAPKLFGRACKEHLTFSLEEVTDIGRYLLRRSGPRLISDTEHINAAITAVLKKG